MPTVTLTRCTNRQGHRAGSVCSGKPPDGSPLSCSAVSGGGLERDGNQLPDLARATNRIGRHDRADRAATTIGYLMRLYLDQRASHQIEEERFSLEVPVIELLLWQLDVHVRRENLEVVVPGANSSNGLRFGQREEAGNARR